MERQDPYPSLIVLLDPYLWIRIRTNYLWNLQHLFINNPGVQVHVERYLAEGGEATGAGLPGRQPVRPPQHRVRSAVRQPQHPTDRRRLSGRCL